MLNKLLNHPLFQAIAPYQSFQETPLGFIDIGARGGIHPLVEPLAGVTGILGFEPDAEECVRMRQELGTKSPWAVWDVEPCALAETTGDATLYRFNTPTNDSLRPANQKMVDRYNVKTLTPIGTLPLQTTTLDEVIWQRRSQENFWGEFIKIDTQSTEYEVLQGSIRTLNDRTIALFIEVEFMQMYQDQRLFADVEIFLRQYGFSCFGFHSLHHRSGKQLDKTQQIGRERAWWADAVFFKDPLAGNSWSKPISERETYVLFSCAMLLGYYDFALELALKTWATGAEAERVKELVFSYAAIPPETTVNEVKDLSQKVQAHPELANIITGHFVDRRRGNSDYDDVILSYLDKI